MAAPRSGVGLNELLAPTVRGAQLQQKGTYNE